MRGLQKLKRVSWASDVNLCQVRLFLSEDSPSLVGLGGAQDHLQAKASWPSSSLYSSSAGGGGGSSDDNLPPGFEGTPPASLLKNKLSQIPLIKWTCPPGFVLDFKWEVVAGDESKEVEIQNQREMRVLEAVYPRPSAIPPNPSLVTGIEDYPHNDEHTPLIPIIPVEEEDAAADTSVADNLPQNTLPMSSQLNQISSTPASQCGASSTDIIPSTGMALALEPELLNAAYAALSTVITSNDQRNMIDSDLLVKILSDPSFIENLVTTQQAVPNSRSQGVTLSDPPPVHINRNQVIPPMPPLAGPSGPRTFYPPPPSRVGPSPPPPMPPPVPKDINYYKSLIQQHGEERNDTTTQPQFGGRHNHQLGVNPEASVSNPPRPRDLKPKIMKPCIYFNSSRGCRHGANCAYQHDVSAQQRVSGIQEVQSSKRMKLDREITGT
ncbi:hypothetical protein LguiA_006826 [Lonicera macranthoides]